MHTSGHFITVSTESALMALYHSFFFVLFFAFFVLDLHATGLAKNIIHSKNPTKVDLFNIHLVFLVKIYAHFLQGSN